MRSTRSGSPRRHLERVRSDAGIPSSGSPSDAPLSDHARSSAIWWSLKRRASRNSPNPGTARHGGMRPFAGHVGDHPVPALRVLVAFERERRNAARRMALDAVGLEQRRDMACVGHLFECRAARAGGIPDMVKTPDCFAFVGLDPVSPRHRLHRLAQIVRADAGAQSAHRGKAIVYPTPVDEAVGGGDDEGLRSYPRTEAPGQVTAAVQDDGKLDAEVVHEFRAFPPRDVGVREHSVELDAVRLRVGLDFVELGHIAGGDRTGGVQKHQRHRLHLPRRHADPVVAPLDVGEASSDEVDEVARPGRRVRRQ